MIANNADIGRPLVEITMQSELAKIDRLRTDLIDCATIDEVEMVRVDLKGIRKIMRNKRMHERAINVASYYISRAERAMGGMLKEMELHGGDRQSEKARLIKPILLLSDIPLTPYESHDFQKMHDIPEPIYEAYLQWCVDEDKRITRTGVLRLSEKTKEPGTLGVEDCLFRFTDVAFNWCEKWPEEHRRVMGHHLVNLGNEILETGGIRP